MKRLEKELIRGWLHEPAGAPRAAMTLFHGAGGDCEAPLMRAVAGAFCDAGFLVFRGDLPFRQRGGSPGGKGDRDREGIRRAAQELRSLAPVRLCLAGHSYGGRQSTMVAAEDPTMVDAMMMLSYPLHPPGQTSKLRTEHFPLLRTPALFVHGTRDAFGSIGEMELALTLIPAKTKLVPIEKAGHGIPPSVATSLPGWLSVIMDS